MSKHVTGTITDFGNQKSRGVRVIKKSKLRHVSLNPKQCSLVTERDGVYEHLPISRRVAEELIALGFGYDL